MGCGGCRKNRKVRTKTPQKEGTPDPIERPDGSLIYKGAAPRKDGFTHDPKNPRRLILDSAPCVYRMTAPLLGSDGSMSTLNQCNNPGYEKRGQDLSVEDCVNCPSRNKA